VKRNANAPPVLTASSPQTSSTSATPLLAREQAYRENNLGVALLEQFKYRDAVEAFTRALAIDEHLALARINLSIALYNEPDVEGALREAKASLVLSPNAPQPYYIMGLIAKAQNRVDEAVEDFLQVLKIDPQDVGTNVSLGQLYSQQRKYKEAIERFRAAIDAEPYNATAVYNLAITLTRTGERMEGQRLIQKFQELRASGAGTVIGQNYLEQGRYAEAVASTGLEAGLVDRRTPAVTFNDATARTFPRSASSAIKRTKSSGSSILQTSGQREYNDATRDDLASEFSGGITLFDYDADGDLDLFEVRRAEQRLYRNDNGRFTDVTAQSGLAGSNAGVGIAAVAGDYDNDGMQDLFVVRYGRLALYRNLGGGRFQNVTAAAKIPNYPYLSVSAAFLDFDHDGDLDIFIAGFADLSKPLTRSGETPMTYSPLMSPDRFALAPNLLLRNNGDGTFTDATASAKVAGMQGHAVAVVPTDFDDRRDVDLLVVNRGARPVLYRNMRDGTFRDVAEDVGLNFSGDYTSAAVGDVNKDGFPDFFFSDTHARGMLALSDGHGHFKIQEDVLESWHLMFGTQDATAHFLDYDNDGLLDLLVTSSYGTRLVRNVGDGWDEVGPKAVSSGLIRAVSNNGNRISFAPGPWLRAFAAGDVDGDGDTDLILRSATGGLRFARNDGGNRNRSLRVQLKGKVSNRSGVQAKVEMRAGSLVQRLEAYAAYPAPAPADIVFGLGQRYAPDAVRVLWPAGIVQAETEFGEAAQARNQGRETNRPLNLSITELDRKPSSCPYLYTWNGERFEFVTDFMGGGEMGYLEEPGRYNRPDPDEYVRIRGDQLRERNGRYDLRVTNELEEALYVDRLQLIAVAHPAGVEVYPNEGMIDPPLPPFKLYTTRGAHAPLAAFDDSGRNVLDRILKLDRKYVDGFRLRNPRGYADEHQLTLKFDENNQNANERYLLLLTGWTDYAWSSDNVAASQHGAEMKLPALQVRDAQGNWKTVIEDIGIPVGRPQTVTVDLTGKFLSASRDVRIVTSMRIYWDQILVDTSDGRAPAEMTRLDPVAAELGWRGFSEEITPDGHEPFTYDYRKVSLASPWKVMPGHYTRTGDVRELLKFSDDMFVISRPGDEISLSFDATALPPLPAGWTRTFLLYADGFSKEMDINSASPDEVAPLPFHGMSRYPYSPPETYPMTDERQSYIERYNTRVVTAEIPGLVISNER